MEEDIKIRCLFNDQDELELLDLARSKEYRSNIENWYLHGGRHDPDPHYKIVDGGRLVHLSMHDHGASDRWYRVRKALHWWERGTRSRISKKYRDHFDYGLRNADRSE